MGCATQRVKEEQSERCYMSYESVKLFVFRKLPVMVTVAQGWVHLATHANTFVTTVHEIMRFAAVAYLGYMPHRDDRFLYTLTKLF